MEPIYLVNRQPVTLIAGGAGEIAQVLAARPKRLLVVISNLGPNIAYIHILGSDESIAAVTVPAAGIPLGTNLGSLLLDKASMLANEIIGAVAAGESANLTVTEVYER